MPRRDRRMDMARRRRDMRDRRRDMRSRRDRRYDMGYYGGDGNSEYSGRYDSTMYSDDYARGGRRSQSGRESDRHYEYPYYMNEYDYAGRRMGRRDYNRYGRDYGSDEDYLEDEELMEWSRELLREVEEKDKAFLTRENITKRAKEMGITFDDFTEDELVVATLMVYTDYSKTLGTGNMDLYIRLAKDWLCDEDAEVQYGEKLAVYYDEIVMGD